MDNESKRTTCFKPLAVSKRDASVMLGMSVRSVENYIAAKIIPSRKIGKRRLILVSDLERFLRSDHPSPTPPKEWHVTDCVGDSHTGHPLRAAQHRMPEREGRKDQTPAERTAPVIEVR